MELTVVNPSAVLGPVLGEDYAASIEIVSRLMNGQMPGLAQIKLGIIDVRDVADLHVRAMVHPEASGQRFVCVSDGPFLFIQDIAQRLKEQFGDKARKVPTIVLPNFLVRFIGLFDASVGTIAPELGKHKSASNQKAKDVLGWKPRTANEAIESSAKSLFLFGLIK